MEHFSNLLFNAVILAAMGFLYTRMFRFLRRHEVLKKVFDGLLFGLIAVAVMSAPTYFSPGISFDTRSIIVSIAGFFGGPFPAFITMLSAIVCRLIQGGIGTVPGIIVIIASGMLGISYYLLRKKYPTAIKPLYLYFFGLLVHVTMLLCMFLFPYDIALSILRAITIPVIVLYPLVSFIIISLMLDKEARIIAEDNLRERENLYSSLLNNLSTGIMIHSPDKKVIFANPKAYKLLGLLEKDLINKKPEELIKLFVCENGIAMNKNEYPVNMVLAELEPITEYIVGIKHRNKKITWVLVNAFPEFDSKKKLKQIVLTFTDITKNKLIQKDIEEKEENLRITLNSIGDGVIATDTNTRIVRMNPEAERITGWKLAEAKGQPLQKIYNTLNENTMKPRSVNPYDNKMDSFDSSNVSILVSKTGSKYRISDSCSPILDQSGDITGVILVFRDVTEEYKMQQELKNNEERFRTIFENAPVLIDAFDKNGRCALWNKECQKVFGWTIDEINTYKDPLSLFYPDLVDRNKVKETFKKDPDEVFKTWHPLTKDGRKLTVKWANFFLLDDVVINLGYDITDQIKNEEELYNISNLLDEIQTMSEVGGWEIDFEQNTHRWTKENYRIHDTTPEEYTPTIESAIEFYTPESRPVIKDAVEKAVKTGRPFDLELEIITAKGKRIAVHTSCKVIQKNGKTVKMLGAFQDITQRKMFESNLKNALIQAEDANRAKSEFLATMSHEIRTPLNGLMGFSEMMEETLTQNEKCKQRDKLINYLKIIKKCGQSLTELINDILELASIEAGKKEKLLEVFAPEEEIRETIDILSFKAEEKNIKLISKIKNLPKAALGARRALKQVIFNLLGNAIKFTDKGEVLIKADYDGDNLLVDIIDTGIGIPLDMQKKILEPFTQVDQSASRKYRGTGLGLTIVSRTLNGLGGKIKIESELAKGTAISFSFPIEPAENLPQEKPDKPKIVTNRDAEVLVVEDDEISILYLKEILSKVCKKFRIATSFAKMQEICSQGYIPDLALIDISLPDATGFDCLKWLKEKYPDKKIKFLAQTANVLEDDIVKYKKAGFDDFIGKPYKKDKFIKVVTENLPE
jgi:PAS domain S-box-containing protein